MIATNLFELSLKSHFSQVTITVKEKELPSAAAANAANDEDKKLAEASGGGADAPPVTPQQQQQTKSMHLLDAHIIFEPLLSSLGLMPQQIQNLSLKNLGSNISVLGSINEFRVDIIESELGGVSSSSSRRSKSKSSSDADHTPSFLCEGVYLQVDFKKVTDINNLEGGGGQKGPSRESKMPPLYMTRAQLKRHTSSLVNFSIDVHFISQKVNMPLLRLVNQIVTMHQNAKETNEELKEMKPTTSSVMAQSAAADTASAASSWGNHRTHHEQFLHGHKKSSSGSSTSSNPLETSVDGDGAKLAAESSRRNMQTPSPSLVLKSQMIRNR